MTVGQVLDALEQRGVRIKRRGDRLAFTPPDAVTDELRSALREHKDALIALLQPHRDGDDGACPSRWRHIPELPGKGSEVDAVGGDGAGLRYRVSLFQRWYFLRFQPSRGAESVDVIDTDGQHRAFASLAELYRWAWVEVHAQGVTYDGAF